jgi:hypothetical protein
MQDLYTKEAQERRDRFNTIISKIDMVLMNKIPEVDDSIWENWEDSRPEDNCDVIDISNASDEVRKQAPEGMDYYCQEHSQYTDISDQCDSYGEGVEVYQWYAVNSVDAEYLADHKQYITYSDALDTYFLAITHFGTAWDYVDSMVDDILGE